MQDSRRRHAARASKPVRQQCGRIMLLAMVIALAQSTVELRGWEEDVHYGLTFWLATRAGFSRQDADIIAKATQSYDDSEHAAAISTVLWIILRNDEGAARELQRKHFPSDAPLPSPPLRRAVAPNSPAARRAAEAALASPTTASNALAEFGEALHPFQDSWSHQGVPDIPLNLRSDMISAHPVSRGGWRSHDADLTHLHVDETLEMARETYALLTASLARNASRRAHPAEPWEKLAPVVRQLAFAADAAAKDAWAAANIPEQRATFASRTESSQTLGVRVMSTPSSAGVNPSDRRLTATEAGRLLSSAKGFLVAWLEKRDISAATQAIDLNALTTQSNAESPAAARDWCEKILTMFLIDDHSAVERLGHGDPMRPGYAQLPRTPQRDGPLRATRAGSSPRLLPTDFVSTTVSGAPGYAVVLTIDRLSHDSLGLVWEARGDGYAITRLLPIVH